jgi:hypothetical protein
VLLCEAVVVRLVPGIFVGSQMHACPSICDKLVQAAWVRIFTCSADRTWHEYHLSAQQGNLYGSISIDSDAAALDS